MPPDTQRAPGQAAYTRQSSGAGEGKAPPATMLLFPAYAETDVREGAMSVHLVHRYLAMT